MFDQAVWCFRLFDDEQTGTVSRALRAAFIPGGKTTITIAGKVFAVAEGY